MYVGTTSRHLGSVFNGHNFQAATILLGNGRVPSLKGLALLSTIKISLPFQIMDHYDRTDAKNVWVLLMDNGLWDKTMARKISKAIRQSGTKVIVLDTENIMHDIADRGLDFSSENLEENIEAVRNEICK